MSNVFALLAGFLIGAVAGVGNLNAADRGNAPADTTDTESTATLDDLAAGRLSLVDLTWTLDENNPYWPAENYEPFHLKTIATIERDGVLSKAFFTPEHLGTHLDAPNHFEKNRPSVDEIAPRDLFAPGVVIDVSIPSESDADYRLAVSDIAAWERQHGPVPARAVVFLHTGWGRHWTNYARYKNQDATGQMHFPGYSAQAARFLVNERNVRGLGIDTLSIDHGLSKDFPVHHIVNAAGRYGLENVAHLDQLPPRGFFVVVAPIKIKTGSGGPTRIFAILDPQSKPR